MSHHHHAFDGFTPWAGEVEAGWSANFVGVLSRDDFTADMTGHRSSERLWVSTSLPAVDEEYFEWIDVFEAVRGGTGTFTMIELGAGYGRWLTNAAAVARTYQRPYRLIGVEAEPTHFRWMRQHLSDNGVAPECVTLVEAAVTPRGGQTAFYVGDPSAWYGQSVAPTQCDRESPGLLRRLQALIGRPNRRRIIQVRAVTLASLLEELDNVDLIDLDVQGVEADVLESAEAMLTARVGRVHVGTHSAENELRLRRLFSRLGWENLNDYPHGSRVDTPWGSVEFHDGVQTWRNPTLGSA